MKHLITSILLLASVIVVQAKYPQGQMGIEISTINGSGLSYQLELDRHSAIKFNGFVYFISDSIPNETDYYFNIGANYQRNIYKSFDHRVYGFVGLSLWYVELKDIDLVIENEFEREVVITDLNRIWNTGIGVGYEYSFKDAVNFCFEIGLQYQSSGNSNISSWIDRDPEGLSFIGIGGSFGLRFKL